MRRGLHQPVPYIVTLHLVFSSSKFFVLLFDTSHTAVESCHWCRGASISPTARTRAIEQGTLGVHFTDGLARAAPAPVTWRVRSSHSSSPTDSEPTCLPPLDIVHTPYSVVSDNIECGPSNSRLVRAVSSAADQPPQSFGNSFRSAPPEPIPMQLHVLLARRHTAFWAAIIRKHRRVVQR